jgi:hypothetical protein
MAQSAGCNLSESLARALGDIAMKKLRHAVMVKTDRLLNI